MKFLSAVYIPHFSLKQVSLNGSKARNRATAIFLPACNTALLMLHSLIHMGMRGKRLLSFIPGDNGRPAKSVEEEVETKKCWCGVLIDTE
jgi:hypothetical protein